MTSNNERYVNVCMYPEYSISPAGLTAAIEFLLFLHGNTARPTDNHTSSLEVATWVSDS